MAKKLESNFAMGRWIRPEVYPLFAAVSFVCSIATFQLARNMLINPEVKVTKANRSAGVSENFEEGKKYKEHGLRKFLRTRPPEVMPSINRFFANDD